MKICLDGRAGYRSFGRMCSRQSRLLTLRSRPIYPPRIILKSSSRTGYRSPLHSRAWLSFAVATLLGMGRACADDWPAWTGPLGRNASIEQGLPDTFDRGNKDNAKWSTRLGTVAFGCPTVANGRVYIGTNYPAVRDDPRFVNANGGVLACLDEGTGETLWRLVCPERTQGFPPRTHMVQQRWGICSSPTVDEDCVYIVTNGNDVLCLDCNGLADGNDGPFQEEGQYMAREGAPPIPLTPSDADILWRYDIPSELDVAPHDVGSCSVLVHGDVLYTSTSNGVGTGSPVYALMPDAPAFIALDKRTGRLLATEDERISQRLFHAQWSSPSMGVVGGTPLVFLGGGDGVCYAFEAIRAPFADGMVQCLNAVWRYDCNPPHYKRLNGKPIYYYRGDLRVYKRKQQRGEDVSLFNAGDGSFVGPNQILATPVFHENRVYVATGRDPEHGLARGVLHCIDATRTGDITESGCLWSYEGIGRSLSSVSIDAGLVYAADFAGRLYCLDAFTGDRYWCHDTGEETWSGPLLADGRVYLNTTQSLWILAAGTEKKVLFRQRGGSETAPVAANGVLYIFMRGHLYALWDEPQE